MGRLTDTVALVAGATGPVGEGIVRALLKAGCVVLVPVRSEARARKLAGYVSDVAEDRLITIQEDFGSEAGAKFLLDTVKWRYPELELVVAAPGEWWQGPTLSAVELGDWKTLLRNNLTTHLIIAKVFLTYLLRQNRGMYIMINSPAADQPRPHAGVTSVLAAAQKMMAQVLATENESARVRIHSLMVPEPGRTGNRPEAGTAKGGTAEQSGDYIVNLYTGAVPNPEDLFHYLP